MPRVRLALLGSSLAAAVSCSETAAPLPPQVIVPSAAASETAPPPPALASAAPTAAPQAKASEEVEHHRLALVLHPGDPPCTVAFDGKLFDEDADTFVITSVTRLATEASGGCAAGEFFDVAKETKKHPNEPNELGPGPLEVGPVVKPGRPRPADFGGYSLIADLNFDGYADVCLEEMSGSYNYSQKCWLFDPARRVFVREPALDPLLFMTVDAVKKQISTSYRLGGPDYYRAEHAWEKGKLVTLREVFTTLEGKPIPKGFDRWEMRRERRGGKLVKVFEGPVRAAP